MGKPSSRKPVRRKRTRAEVKTHRATTQARSMARAFQRPPHPSAPWNARATEVFGSPSASDPGERFIYEMMIGEAWGDGNGLYRDEGGPIPVALAVLQHHIDQVNEAAATSAETGDDVDPIDVPLSELLNRLVSMGLVTVDEVQQTASLTQIPDHAEAGMAARVDAAPESA